MDMAVCEHRTVPTSRPPLWRRAPLLAGLLIVLGATVLASCGGSSNPTASSTTTTTSQLVVPQAPPTSSNTTSSSTTTASPTTGTREETFDPYGPDGKILPTVTITRFAGGTCVSPGVAGSSSYRCFAHPVSTVYDPCFAPPHAASGLLVCVADPATPVGVAFDVGALPTALAGVPAHRVWAMRLANGQACVLVNAAWGGLGPFACPSPGIGKPEADCHTPKPGSPWWSTACQLGQAKGFPFKPFRVEVVWR
jgi:hypothetical protein